MSIIKLVSVFQLYYNLSRPQWHPATSTRMLLQMLLGRARLCRLQPWQTQKQHQRNTLIFQAHPWTSLLPFNPNPSHQPRLQAPNAVSNELILFKVPLELRENIYTEMLLDESSVALLMAQTLWHSKHYWWLAPVTIAQTKILHASSIIMLIDFLAWRVDLWEGNQEAGMSCLMMMGCW